MTDKDDDITIVETPTIWTRIRTVISEVKAHRWTSRTLWVSVGGFIVSVAQMFLG